MQERAARAGSADELLRQNAQQRIVITHVTPEVDGGRYPVKACIGDAVKVEADIFSDGHGKLAAVLEYWHLDDGRPSEVAMSLSGNDRWSAAFEAKIQGRYSYRIVAWHDAYGTWCDEAGRRIEAGQPMDPEFALVRDLIENAAASSAGSFQPEFRKLLADFDALDSTPGRMALLTNERARLLFESHAPRSFEIRSDHDVPILVERRRAGFSAWYELMPRSQSDTPKRHGTFDDVIARLPYVRDMGFDILYFPPIHPIGTTNRKGRNNSLGAEPGDPGSPYATGNAEGGHDAIHSELGTFEDFSRLLAAAGEHGLEIALDFAIQCSPDHPWIKEHPEWFDWRPDGSIRHAENPPKKYEDIVNVHFYGKAFPELWFALRDVVLFWVDKGVKIFRVDNPHTKPFPFWEWLIAEVQRHDQDVIFLAEAFTRPNVMLHLAKIGFTQSYSYFTWRNTKQELIDYMTELTRGPSRAFMRPNFFVNTPDINPHYLQTSGRPGFRVRLLLAATLATNYGIYSGFELCEAAALPGKEEYLNSEKYEIRAWDWDRAGHIREDIARINALRNASPALQEFANVEFYNAWNDNILYYGKAAADRSELLLFAINLDPHAAQGAHFEVPLWEFGLADDASIDVENLITGEHFAWAGKVQHVLLDPEQQPYAMWRLTPPGYSP